MLSKGLRNTFIVSSIIGLIVWVIAIDTILQTGGGIIQPTLIDKILTLFSLIVVLICLIGCNLIGFGLYKLFSRKR